MTNATNLIHRLALRRAGVLTRLRLHFARWKRLGSGRAEAKDTATFLTLRAALAAIDDCAADAELLAEVRGSARRLYCREIGCGRSQESGVRRSGSPPERHDAIGHHLHDRRGQRARLHGRPRGRRMDLEEIAMHLRRILHVTRTRPSRLERSVRRRWAVRDIAVALALAITAGALLWLAGAALCALVSHLTR